MAAERRFRDVLRSVVPAWLADRPGRSVAFRVLWAMVAPLDVLAEVAMQGILSWFPGLGTSTSLPLIGRSRGILRGRVETTSSYADRLRGWLDTWREAAGDERLAREIQAYVGGSPRIRIFRRYLGACMTLESDGTVTRNASTAWDWDGVYFPERAGTELTPPFWSDEWIVIYPTTFPVRPGTLGGVTVDGFALGHLAKATEVDALKGLIATWKGAHSRVRAVIWTTDAAAFDPAVPASMPAGTWGAWGTRGDGSRVASARNLTTCRFWEPR